MTTTPAALSDQTLTFTRMLVGANLAEGITTTIPSGDLYSIIDELLRLRSRPNEGMREALQLADSYIREHTDHHGDCELSQSDGDHPCTCDHGFTRAQITAALALPAAVAPYTLSATEREGLASAYRKSVEVVAPAPAEQARGEEPVSMGQSMVLESNLGAYLLSEHGRKTLAAAKADTSPAKTREEVEPARLIADLQKVLRWMGPDSGYKIYIERAIAALSAPSLEERKDSE